MKRILIALLSLWFVTAGSQTVTYMCGSNPTPLVIDENRMLLIVDNSDATMDLVANLSAYGKTSFELDSD